MSVAELNTTRINRLLRPLRVTCIQLDTYARSADSIGPSSSGQATYSKITTWRPSEKGPLALILPPQASLNKTRPPWQSGGVRNAEIAKKIYAVHTAFKNVLQAALGSGEKIQPVQKMGSLAALCATIVGEGIQEEIDLNLHVGIETVEDEEEQAIIEEMYEYVPVPYRIHTLVAHALSMVLDLCPHDPTLLTLLLRTTTSYRLQHESQILLHSLLQVVIPQTAPRQEPLCHPAHVTYLSDLLTSWTTPLGPASSEAPERITFSITSFMEELLPVLFENASNAVWTSEAIRDLAKVLQKNDVLSLVHLSACLVATISSRSQYSQTAEEPVLNIKGLRPRLTKWMRFILQDTHRRDTLDPTIQDSVLDLICDTSDLGLCNIKPSHLKEFPVAPSVVSLAMVVLAKWNLASTHTARLLSVLQAVEPSNTTYDPFILHLYPQKSQSGPSSTFASGSSTEHNSPGSIIPTLKNHARILRKHDLPAHEAALWSCALHRLESDWLTGRAMQNQQDGHGDLIISFRAELVTQVEKAQKRCGPIRPSHQISSASDPSGKGKGKENTTSTVATPMRTPGGVNDQRWDDFAGCWMTRTPAKAGRMGRETIRRPGRRPRPPLATITPGKTFMDRLVGKSQQHANRTEASVFDGPRKVDGEVNPKLRPFKRPRPPLATITPRKLPMDELEETLHDDPMLVAETPGPARRFAQIAALKRKAPHSPFKSPLAIASPLRRRHHTILAAPSPFASRRSSMPAPMASPRPAHRRWSAHTPIRSRVSLPLRVEDKEPRSLKGRWGAHTPKRSSVMLALSYDVGEEEEEDDDDDTEQQVI